MKNVLTWMRKRIVLVVAVVLIVIALPAAWWISSGLNASFRQAQQEKVDAELRKVGGQEVVYQLPALSPEAERVEVRSAPNERLTAWFGEQAERQRQEAQLVAEQAAAFNRRDREPLVQGLFPEPSTARDAQIKPYEFLRALIGYRGAPSVVDQLMEQVGAGSPPEPQRVRDRIETVSGAFLAELERRRGPGQQLSTSEQEEMDDRLRQARIDAYQQQARKLSMYIERDVLREAIEMPADASPASPPSVHQLFEYQFNVWVVEDVLRALDIANRDERGRRQRVDEGVVKRVLSIDVDINERQYSLPVFVGEQNVAARSSPPSQGGLVGTSADWSITGRFSHPDNQVYDVVEVQLSIVADARRLPRLLESFGRANFMSVLDVDLQEVDVWEDLRLGFYYGTEPVVRADITVETVWLRSWTAPLMPERWREGLAAQVPEVDESEQG